MIDLFLFFILLFGFLIGLKRGFILQLLHLVGFIIAFIAAAAYYDDVASHIALWIPYPELADDSAWAIFLQALPLEKAFYNGISFVLIFLGVKIILQIVASMLDIVASIPLLKTVNKLLGAVLGFLEVYLIIFILVYIFALVPVATVQEYINDSSIALFMLEKKTYFSEKILQLWF